jgi:hypothetical protein
VPNPKDPQDAEVARMLLEDPPEFARTANRWAVQYAGAPRQDTDYSQYSPVVDKETNNIARCVDGKKSKSSLSPFETGGILGWGQALDGDASWIVALTGRVQVRRVQYRHD